MRSDGESRAHLKHRYFATLSWEFDDEGTARHFEHMAEQVVLHALGHLDLPYPKARMTVAKALEMAIEGETFEYTEMYPSLRSAAEAEGQQVAVAELDLQVAKLQPQPQPQPMLRPSRPCWTWRPSA